MAERLIEYSREVLSQWLQEGKTHRWIAEQLGCAGQHVSRLCRREGLPARRRGPRSAEGHPDWKGGRTLDKSGYVLIYSPDHPNRRKMGQRPGRYVAEHRLVMEKHLGRLLLRSEVVHHKNRVKDDNRLENLELFQTNAEHLAKELEGRCPKWSKEGKQRISEGVRKARTRERLARDARRCSQTTAHPSSSPDSTTQSLSQTALQPSP